MHITNICKYLWVKVCFAITDDFVIEMFVIKEFLKEFELALITFPIRSNSAARFLAVFLDLKIIINMKLILIEVHAYTYD